MRSAPTGSARLRDRAATARFSGMALSILGRAACTTKRSGWTTGYGIAALHMALRLIVLQLGQWLFNH